MIAAPKEGDTAFGISERTAKPAMICYALFNQTVVDDQRIPSGCDGGVEGIRTPGKKNVRLPGLRWLSSNRRSCGSEPTA
jgi:hypothetical protein